jgi:hypothetical protein
MTNAYKILVLKPENRPHGRPRRRWKDNIQMELREICLEGVDWFHLVQDRDRWRALVNTVMKSWNFLNIFSGRTVLRGAGQIVLIHISAACDSTRTCGYDVRLSGSRPAVINGDLARAYVCSENAS